MKLRLDLYRIKEVQQKCSIVVEVEDEEDTHEDLQFLIDNLKPSFLANKWSVCEIIEDGWSDPMLSWFETTSDKLKSDIEVLEIFAEED